MMKIRIYDNGGKTCDRYTVVFADHDRAEIEDVVYLGMSSNPFHPQGIGQHGFSENPIDEPTYQHLGSKINFDELPQYCKKFVMRTFIDLCNPEPVVCPGCNSKAAYSIAEITKTDNHIYCMKCEKECNL